MKLLRWLKRWLLEKEEDSVFFLQGHDRPAPAAG